MPTPATPDPPASPDVPEARVVELPASTGRAGDEPVELAVHERGDGPAVVLCHGFPELGYSWRHQLPALADAGFRAIAPDQRGYGGSSKPAPVESYDIHHLTGDLVRLLDALEIQRAVFVGHDWGGFVVWALPTLHPERVAGVVGVNTPYLPRAPRPPTEMLRALAGGNDDTVYVLWFQEPGVAEAVLDRDVELVFEKLVRRGLPPEELFAEAMPSGADMNPFRRLAEIEPTSPRLLSPEEQAHYVDVFRKSGFRGGVSWYRNFDRNWETAPEVGVARVEVPCLMVTAEWDPVLTPAMAAGMPALCPDLETHTIRACGHWTQQEKPAELNRILVDWLRRRFA